MYPHISISNLPKYWMPTPRKPALVQQLSGSWAHDPKRRRTEPTVEHPLGDAPKYFTNDERKVWRELALISFPGVLKNCDQWTVETLCLLMAKQRRRDEMKIAELALLVKILGTLGMTPADRSKVSAGETVQKTDDPLAEFLN